MNPFSLFRRPELITGSAAGPCPQAVRSLLLFTGFLLLPFVARADSRPDFDDDAKPILKMQPELLHYVKANFDVKETGYSKVPGDDGHRPPPPYIFRARHRGDSGPYNITLLIQPGPPGHVLFVKQDGSPSGAPAPYMGGPPPYTGGPAPYAGGPAPYTGSPSSEAPSPSDTSPPSVYTPQASAPSSTPAATPQQPSSMEMPPAPTGTPTSSTPSGPIKLDSGAFPTNSQSLAPPPDPAPNH